MNIKYILPSLLLATSVHVFAESTPRHGYIDSPPSRAFLCSSSGGNLNKECGLVQYEPQSVEGPKGFPEKGPADGQIPGAGRAKFAQLNEQTPVRWHKIALNSGENTFNWTLTAAHSTTSWRFFITNQNWDPNKPLTRADFDLTPFCEQFDNGKVPASKVSINCDVPKRTGYQVILGVWDIADTGNAFYQVIDADMANSD
ncbi:lytic polysaccharide monooxygenase [Klebsiella sp. BIGb0407]|uniref:lytic polysaccharide monooxygenase n=1 Tax=Klebsiella sp. BIGb0407 TaxID=2940603 RepID=UPI00216AA079|nr:lytic polysaccharide monooxygenase [Klebsiella sp. BIGb0407]MCS3431202.1 chitin-binding protein [Klebsiella sp. BIGb0407]